MTENSRYFWGYTFVALTSVAAIFVLLRLGEAFFPVIAISTAARATHGAAAAALPQLLAALLTVIVVTRACGMLIQKIGQPAVMGEVIGGILLGPSFLSSLAPTAMDALVPSVALPALGMIAQLGVLLFMFVIGLELDLGQVRQSGRAALAISHASILLPLWLGIGAGFLLFEAYAPLGVSFTGFALFIGVAMSVTAFPILARILTDMGLQKTPLGMLALTCAAVDDVTAWCLLALVVGVLQASYGAVAVTLALTFGFVMLMLFVARPLFVKILPYIESSQGLVSEAALAIVLICLLIAALATEVIGVHALFGAFLLGAIIPHSSRVAKDLENRLADLVRVFFLPAFFAYTGLRTQIGLLNSWQDLTVLGLIILLATAGKIGGAYVAAQFSGLPKRESLAVGFLMNARGLVALIVLNVGLDLGVMDARLFTIMVLMAVVTTMTTGPGLKKLGY